MYYYGNSYGYGNSGNCCGGVPAYGNYGNGYGYGGNNFAIILVLFILLIIILGSRAWINN